MLSGIVYMLTAVLLLSAMDALAKWMTLEGISAIQILALRSLILIPFLLLSYAIRRQLHQLKPVNVPAQIARGSVAAFAPLCFFLGIPYIPLTDAVLVAFSSIFIITILAVIFLGERPGKHRWGSVIVGFMGVAIIVNPSGGGSGFGYLMILCSSVAYSVMIVSGRYLSKTETVGSLVFSFNVAVAMITVSLLPWFWTAMNAAQIMQTIVLATLSICGQYLVTLACARLEASLISSFDYTALIWAMAFDYLIWTSTPTLAALGGALLIIGSGLYLIYRERLLAKKVSV